MFEDILPPLAKGCSVLGKQADDKLLAIFFNVVSHILLVLTFQALNSKDSQSLLI